MSRLYVIESTPTITGANADHRWELKPTEVIAASLLMTWSFVDEPTRNAFRPLWPQFKDALLHIGASEELSAEADLTLPVLTPPVQEKSIWSRPLSQDLYDHRGSSIVIAGDDQPAFVHALTHAMNDKLGNVGKTVFYTDPLEAGPLD
jgi:molybdopterin-containing oxidoreductase family iron-sulfur binding subunit